MSEENSLTDNNAMNSSNGELLNGSSSQGSTPSDAASISFDSHIVPIPVVTTVPRSSVPTPSLQQTPVQAAPSIQNVPAQTSPAQQIPQAPQSSTFAQPQTIPMPPQQMPAQQAPTQQMPAQQVATPSNMSSFAYTQTPAQTAQQTYPPVVAPPAEQAIAGATNPVSTNKKSGPSKMFIIGIILFVLALIGIGLTLWFTVLSPGAQEEPMPEGPSSSQVESAFQGADIDAPDIDSFKYMDTSNLTGPKINNYKASGVTKEGSSFYCDGQATATYDNAAVTIEVPLTMRMEYNADTQNWMRGTVREGTMSSQPKAPANLQEIVTDFPNILKAKDPNVANQFEGCQITTDGTLTTEGGQISFILTKEIDGEQKTCTAKTNISWNKERGWVVSIASFEGLDTPTQQTPAQDTPTIPTETPSEPSNESSNGNTNSGGTGGGTTNLQPTMLLQCWTGDLVEVPGTVQIQSDGRVLLKTDDVIRVEFNGRVYITTYFELTGNQSFTNGRHIVARGAISATGNLPEAPLVINFDYS